MGPKTYEVFNNLNNSVIENHISFKHYKNGYIKKNYSKEMYIYIRNNYDRNIPKECVYGFLTYKNDPKQIVKKWVIISGKKYCKGQEEWILSF
jgi:hypothetical protein